MPPHHIALLGGSGFIGRAIARTLLSRTDAPLVRIVTRNAARARERAALPAQVEFVEADVSTGPAAVRTATDGCDAVVNLIGLLHESSGMRTFERAHTGVAQALARTGPPRIVHLSALGANPASRSVYARTKAAAEVALPTAVVLRPSIVYGPEDAFFNRFAGMAAYSPALPLVGGGTTLYQPVHVDDVANAAVAALDAPPAIYELGGKDTLSFRELMQMVLRVTGRSRALVSLPYPVAAAQGAMFEALHAAFPSFPPLITRDQVELLKYDNVVSQGALTFADLGVSPRGCSDEDIAYIR